MTIDTRQIIFAGGLQPDTALAITKESLIGADDGELFLEHSESESLVFDDGQLKNASSNISRGFGLRSVLGEAVAYAHASDISEAALKRAAATVKEVRGEAVKTDLTPAFGSNQALYIDANPLKSTPFALKLEHCRRLIATSEAKVNMSNKLALT